MTKLFHGALDGAYNLSDNGSLFQVQPMDPLTWAPPVDPVPFDAPVQPSFMTSGGDSAPFTGTMAGTTTQMALYLTEPGDTTAISINDIHQGSIADCFVLAAIGELALVNPTAISNKIVANANGTESVTLFAPKTTTTTTTTTSGGKHPKTVTTTTTSTVEAPTAVTVTNSFPAGTVNSYGQDIVNGVQEAWPSVLEQAVANLDGGYSAISNGGNPTTVMTQLTGKAAAYYSPAGITASEIQGWQSAKDLIVMDTLSSGALPDNLVNWHCYMFEGLTSVGGSAAVLLGNPWGCDQPSPVLLSQFSSCFSAVAVGASA